MRILWVVLWSLGLVVLSAGLVWAIFVGGGLHPLSSPVDRVRPWAEVEYDAVEAPVASAVDGSDGRFQKRILSVKRTAGDSDPTELGFEIETSKDSPEEWTPDYNVRRIGAAGGFRFEDGGRSGVVNYVGARTLARQHVVEKKGMGEQMELRFFSPAMEPLDEGAMEAEGISLGHTLWAPITEPATGLRVALDMAGYEAIKWRLRGFFDRQTKVRLAVGGGWTSSGDEAQFESRLSCLHDAQIRMVVDFCHGPVERFALLPADGEAVEGDDFRVELVGVLNGTPMGSPMFGGAAALKYSYRVGEVGGESTVGVFSIAPEVAQDAVTIEALGRDGQKLWGRVTSTSGVFKQMSWQVRAEEIDRFEVVYRPNYERLLIDLPALGGVPEANRGAANLFECVMPMGEVDGEWELRKLVGNAAQLSLKGSSSMGGGGMRGFFPLDLSGMTVGEVVEMYARQRPELSFRVDPVALSLEITEPGAKPWWERVWESVGGWF